MTASVIPVPMDDDNKMQMLDHGLVELDATAYEADSGATWSHVLKRLEVKDMLELRYGIIEQFGESDGDDGDESTDSAVNYLLR